LKHYDVDTNIINLYEEMILDLNHRSFV